MAQLYKVFFLFLMFAISSCALLDIKKDDIRQDDITNNRRNLYIKNYGNLDTAKEKFQLKKYEEEKDEDNLL